MKKVGTDLRIRRKRKGEEGATIQGDKKRQEADMWVRRNMVGRGGEGGRYYARDGGGKGAYIRSKWGVEEGKRVLENNRAIRRDIKPL